MDRHSFFEVAKTIVTPPAPSASEEDRRIRAMPTAEIVELLKAKEQRNAR